jgi:hypothetical protein
VKIENHHSKLLRREYTFTFVEVEEILREHVQKSGFFKPPPFGRWEFDEDLCSVLAQRRG